MLATWTALHPNGASYEEALIWLQGQGLGKRIADVLLPVLTGLWTKAWEAGLKAAAQAAGHKVATLTTELTSTLAQLASAWVSQIAQTTLKLLAKALASGAALTVLQAILQDIERAKDIALTEITRVMAIVAQKVYTSLGILRWRWVIEDNNACPACKSNAAAGPWPIGVPFPSGAPYPPDHYRCRCGTVPA